MLSGLLTGTAFAATVLLVYVIVIVALAGLGIFLDYIHEWLD